MGAVGDQRGFQLDLRGDAVAVGFDAVLQREFVGGQRLVIGVAAAAAGERVGVAVEAVVERRGEAWGDAFVAFTEVDALHERADGEAVVGAVGDLEEGVVAGDFEGGRIQFPGPVFAPMPGGVEGAEAVGAEAFGAADAPVVFVVFGEAEEAGLDLAAALLVEPVEAAEGGELGGEEVAEFVEVENVEGGVVEEALGEGAFGPVGGLRIFIEGDAEVFFEEGGEADAFAGEELAGEHRVEDAFGAEAAEVVEEADVEIAAVHEQVFRGEAGPEGGEVEAGGEDIDEVDLAGHVELQEADARAVVVHVVRLGIEGGFVGAIEGREEGRELRGLVDEEVGRRGGHRDREDRRE